MKKKIIKKKNYKKNQKMNLLEDFKKVTVKS